MNARFGDGGRTVSDGLLGRGRLVASAATPVRPADLLHAWRRRDGGRDRFERAVASFVDAEAVETYTTYRRALFDCLRSLHRSRDRGRSVLVPAYSAPDFEAAVEAAGLAVKHCDVDPGTLAIDPSSLEEQLTDDTLAAFAVNLLGYGNRMDEIADRCEAHDVALIEVLGYSLGTEYRGRRLGTFGDGAVINFQEGKPIPVGGGLVAWNRGEFDPTREVRDPGPPNYAAMVGYAAFARPRPYWVYDNLVTALEQLGFDTGRFTSHSDAKDAVDYQPPFCAMSDFQGALADSILDRLESHRRQRARTARFYADALSGREELTLVRPASGVGNVQYVRYPVLVDDPDLRDELQAALYDAGVQTSALYRGIEVDGERFPGADRLRRSMLTLPTHPYVSPADRARVVEVVDEQLSASAS